MAISGGPEKPSFTRLPWTDKTLTSSDSLMQTLSPLLRVRTSMGFLLKCVMNTLPRPTIDRHARKRVGTYRSRPHPRLDNLQLVVDFDNSLHLPNKILRDLSQVERRYVASERENAVTEFA